MHSTFNLDYSVGAAQPLSAAQVMLAIRVEAETDEPLLKVNSILEMSGAADRTRTGTPIQARDFKSLVSTIPPQRHVVVIGCMESLFKSKKPCQRETKFIQIVAKF